ncbi:DNA-binding transcriptional LysR family regulator [Aminobacter lissarensis]|uniref:DNA-binding transcriptional LysR family regulator n=1 Tax=Aminobacter carboxidus TaxID=376165 RepID=A0A8E1WMJ7_9HYPH|nr:LysR family transcriptional regulator [Aminobacter lissarensis]MBB6470366.1 DNA-binding transcriptional LysR family regulator [Aminobacter lissarensis]
MALDSVDLFLEVVRTGSFSGAARATGIPVSTVSQRIAALEARLGATLLKRTTRRLALTEAGAGYHAVAARALAELRGFEAELTDTAAGLSGKLKVASTIAMDDVLAPVLSGYLEAYPNMALELHLSGRNTDLFTDGIDVAIRVGALRDDSGLVARSLGAAALKLVASPDYLKAQPPIDHPNDIEAHQLISFAGYGTAQLHHANGEACEVDIAGRFAGNQLSSLRHQAVAGHGIALVPAAFLARELASGELVTVLDDWRGEAQPIHIVYLAQRIVSKRLRTFIDHVVAHFPRRLFAD